MKDKEFNIFLKENIVPCCVSKARPIPIAYQQALRNESDELLRKGIITSVTEATEKVNPVVVEPKRNCNGQYNDKIRLCVYFQPLNKYFLRERNLSANALEVVQNIQADHPSLLSPFDVSKGYHQIELAQKSKNLTTLLTPFGRFRCDLALHRLASTLSVSITIAECLKNCKDYLTLLKLLTTTLCIQLMLWPPTLPLLRNF